MKFAKINTGKLFRLKKSRSVRKSNQSSFNSQTTSSSASEEDDFKKQVRISTPTSVLASTFAAVSTEEWTEVSTAVYFELKQAFEIIDRDGDTKITKEELKSLLIWLGAEPPNKEELQLMLNVVDRDGDGCISLEKFHARGGR